MSDAGAVTWRMAARTLTRPYRVNAPMVALALLVPFYIFIAEAVKGRPTHVPAIALDGALPLQPVWALIYGALYLFLIVLPIFIVREDALIRRTLYAYLLVWSAAYACFWLYPTSAPRPPTVVGDGFAAWGLRLLYDADPPYNCFPSLHVAHSFVSAFAARRVHRGVGAVSIAAAALVALSTLLTKQHYALDVVAGIALAVVAYALFLRTAPRAEELDRRLAPRLALPLAAMTGVVVMGYWVVYALRITT